ncbi:MAG: hypothetical protein AAGG07_03570 [Planctomycetota bacterium]
MHASRRTRTLTALLLGAAYALMAGCNIVTPVFFAVYGPPRTQPQHELVAERATVVFVDDRSNEIARRSLRVRIAEGVQQQLLERGVLEDMIDTRATFQIASNESLNDPQPISRIGYELGASAIIYLTIDRFVLSEDNATIAPVCEARLKVLDLDNRSREWPASPAGYPVTVRLPRPAGYAPSTNADLARLEDQLADLMALGVAQVFYEHESSQTVYNQGFRP